MNASTNAQVRAAAPEDRRITGNQGDVHEILQVRLFGFPYLLPQKKAPTRTPALSAKKQGRMDNVKNFWLMFDAFVLTLLVMTKARRNSPRVSAKGKHLFLSKLSTTNLLHLLQVGALAAENPNLKRLPYSLTLSA